MTQMNLSERTVMYIITSLKHLTTWDMGIPDNDEIQSALDEVTSQLNPVVKRNIENMLKEKSA